ncbi:MAG TPA: TrpB-like pyridoxal phosphate-dependent enzyme [Ignavibacteriaceae bacterium]|jgi:tryptophan synthase beta chain|nr:MAG: Tryptophan synthase beta chain [Ignavibacteria bacterium ADurb.Bin266]OQY73678.1 MAG: TrpB-like pyridoxal-phosphate dependent enzyme [Ignavibacteriales bacterium UTCHB2]HQF41736.1 TrpB-like pyridoxal phosphate-dependent enzyme [Ignavibacteriaceae bacterium]HQI40551.1 TrpB-like pyridoxal phosphate-dependent enzyme [Ignavibacteriaceae bacterium]HQJ45051.1 TrpB-like pyridoxal phosphate-dependent enzyme [Ignavibacteriaceae bacterium]
MSASKKILLDESELPQSYYNIQADMPNPMLPPLHPATKQPIKPEDLSPLFPMELIKQEVSKERYIEIPDEVRKIYKLYRPTPLYRAYELEKALDTPAKIYYKYEGVSPAGSHKPNTAIAQAFYNKNEGVKGLTTETGAGQWGSALSFACHKFGLNCEIYMVKISYEQKPYRKVMMNTWGATVIASPSRNTNSGRKILEQDPNSPGSLGIAISEAVERAAETEGINYALGSVLNHVLLHQTVIGQEAIRQLEMTGDFSDIVIAPFGGGSNFAGIAFPFLRYNFQEGKNIRCIAVEPASCPKLTKGEFRYDFGDTVGLTPLIPMYTLGHTFVPEPIHAGGLRYHGAGAIISQLLKDKLIEASAVPQLECFEAGVKFAQTEGIIPAPEATHGIAQVIREAQKAKIEGKQKTILFNLCGHGYFDMSAYQAYLNDELVNHELTEEELYTALRKLDTPVAV